MPYLEAAHRTGGAGWLADWAYKRPAGACHNNNNNNNNNNNKNCSQRQRARGEGREATSEPYLALTIFGDVAGSPIHDIMERIRSSRRTDISASFPRPISSSFRLLVHARAHAGRQKLLFPCRSELCVPIPISGGLYRTALANKFTRADVTGQTSRCFGLRQNIPADRRRLPSQLSATAERGTMQIRWAFPEKAGSGVGPWRGVTPRSGRAPVPR